MTGRTPRSAEARRRQLIAEWDAEAKRFLDEEVDHYVYRCYDAEDRLLYIGCTQDVVGRMQVHASSWDNPASAHLNMYMARYEVEKYVGRRAGRAAEKAAIAAEAPYLNVHHNKGRGAKRVPVEPVTKEELAEASANVDEWCKRMGIAL